MKLPIDAQKNHVQKLKGFAFNYNSTFDISIATSLIIQQDSHENNSEASLNQEANAWLFVESNRNVGVRQTPNEK